MSLPVRMRSVRPLVRYVDETQAVIDTHFTVLPPVSEPRRHTPPPCRAVELDISIDGSDGFHDEGHARVQLKDHRGSFRFEVASPERWWPAGMGEQALYTLTLQLLDPGVGHTDHTVTFGLTSVRRDRVLGAGFDPSLLVNGRICDLDTIVVVDRVDDKQLLPITGESILLVRDHFGADVLYEAADRAGILLIQCVPVDAKGELEESVEHEIDRLASHPSLAGYFASHLGRLSGRVARKLRELDPTRMVFDQLPLIPAA